MYVNIRYYSNEISCSVWHSIENISVSICSINKLSFCERIRTHKTDAQKMNWENVKLV